MRKNLVVGVLAEVKNIWEKRAAITPADVAWLTQRGVPVEAASSELRIYQDTEYQKAGAKIVGRFRKAQLLVGIKEPPIESLVPNVIYMVFSHTAKGQVHNRPLLRAFLDRKITLVDYEHIQEPSGERLVYFGRFAGICGMIDTLHVLGRKLEGEGIPNPFSRLRGAAHYGNYDKARAVLKKIGRAVREAGLDRRLAPFIIGITGHGNVSQGAQEVLEAMGSVPIHPRDIRRLTETQRLDPRVLHRLVFQREEKLRSRDGRGFYFEEYLRNPQGFESNMDHYLPHLNILINASYWDSRYPRLVTEAMLRRLHKKQPFRLKVIGDLSCDIQGTIEITRRVTTPEDPAFLYQPASGKIRSDLSGPGVAVMAIDNLPCEFPSESSAEFSNQIRDYVYQIAAHGVTDLTNHHALPREIRGSVVTQNGRLTERFKYLGKEVRGKRKDKD